MSSHFTCACCGETHEGLLTNFGFQLPGVVWDIPPDQRKESAHFNDDLCEYQKRCFIRGVLPVPFLDTDGYFGWGVWAEVDRAVFKRYLELFRADGSAEPLHAGKLANSLPVYAGSLDAPLQIQFHDAKKRPTFTLLAEDHSPLALEQRNGINSARYHQILEQIEAARREFEDDTTMDEEQEERWCEEQRKCVVDYLRGQGLAHGEVGDWPAWHIAPYVSVWAIESLKQPGFVGWWAISGDLPTDYVTCGPERHPRAALRDFAGRWKIAAAAFAEGRQPEGFTMGSGAIRPDLAGLLEERAKMLLRLAEEDGVWEEKD